MKNYQETLLIALSMGLFTANATAKNVNEVAKDKNETTVVRQLTLTEKGDSCMDCNDFFHAMKFYEQQHGLQPNHANTWKLANTYYKMGRNKDCVDLLEALPDDSLDYRDNRTLFYATMTIPDNGFTGIYGADALGQNPYDSELVVSLAAHYLSENAPALAEKICEDYLKLDSTNVLVRRQLGYAYYMIERYEQAVNVFEKLEKEGNGNYESAFVLGMSYEQMRNYRLAHEYLLKAVEMNKRKNFLPLHHLAKVCLNEPGECREGIAVLKECLELIQPDPKVIADLYTELGEGHFNVMEYLEAAKSLEKSIEYNQGSNPIAYYNTALMYGKANQAAKMKTYFNLFLKNASKLEDNEENRKIIKTAKDAVRNQRS